MFEYFVVRFKFTTATLQYITVDMLFNIIGHKIDGNCESWKYMGQKTSRNRVSPGRGRLSHTLG